MNDYKEDVESEPDVTDPGENFSVVKRKLANPSESPVCKKQKIPEVEDKSSNRKQEPQVEDKYEVVEEEDKRGLVEDNPPAVTS